MFLGSLDYIQYILSLSFRNGALKPQQVTRFGVVLVIHQFGIISQIAFMSMEVIFLLLGNFINFIKKNLFKFILGNFIIFIKTLTTIYIGIF